MPRSILFCNSALAPRDVDPDFADERDAAVRAGFTVGLVDHTAAASGQVATALRNARDLTGPTIYRGWMLKPSEYAALHAELTSRGVALVNDPAGYRSLPLPTRQPSIHRETHSANGVDAIDRSA